MLKIFFMLFMMMWLFYYISSLELSVGFLLGIFMLIIVVDWESLMINYVSEVFGLDLMSVFLVMLSLWMSMLMLLASYKSGIVKESIFLNYLILMVLLLVMCFSCLNLLGFFLFFEGVLFPIVMMIFNYGFQPERLQAGIYMLFYTLFGSLPLLVFLLMNSGSLNYVYLLWSGFSVTGLLFFMVIFAFLVKIPMFFCHLWLPKAHVEAPIAGSMILAGVLLKLGVYGLYRFSIFLVDKLMMFSSWVMSVSLVGGVFVSLICMSQIDLKSLIAYSSVCHMGLVLGGFFSLNSWGGSGGLLLMLGHGLCSSGLFCLANIMYERFFSRSLILLSGMGVIFPFLSLWWFFFSIINMAAPPSMNFLGEIFLMGSMIKFSLILLIPLGLMTFFSACYSLYLYSYTQHGSGWFVFSVGSIEVREYILMFLHFFPLLLWILKMDMFMGWV